MPKYLRFNILLNDHSYYPLSTTGASYVAPSRPGEAKPWEAAFISLGQSLTMKVHNQS